MAPTYRFKGHTFYSEADFNEAKKEAEAIEYLKTKTDFENMEMVVKLYDRLIERKMISTTVGIDFLNELRTKISESGFITEDKLKPLPEVKKSVPQKVKKKKSKDISREAKLIRTNTFLVTIIIALVVIIAGMFVIVLTGKSSPLKSVYEEQVLNEYAAWKQELQQKEQEVNDKLFFLEQYGIYFETAPEVNEDTKESE